ncbi:MAG: Rrf2 family transcriptional regulator [Pseudomonas sp.]
MKTDSRLSGVLHAILHMAQTNVPMTSEALARCMSTHAVVVRRTMGLLRDAGLVAANRGHGGGWRIAADLSKVTLRNLHEALGEPALFAVGNRSEHPDCLVEQVVNTALDSAFADAEALLMSRFESVTLAELAAEFARRHGAHHAGVPK